MAYNTQSLYRKLADENILAKSYDKRYRLTPIIVTFYENVVTKIDAQNFIEMGLQAVRVRMTNVTKCENLKLLDMLREAEEWVCEKYDVSSWPIATCIDIPNAAIRTGYISSTIPRDAPPVLKIGDRLQLTSRKEFWNQCTADIVYMDDPYTLRSLKPGNEITFCIGGTQLICTEVIDHETIVCEVIYSGILRNNEFVAVRGILYKRPSLSQNDMDIVQFSQTFKFDCVTLICVRFGSTVKKLKNMYGDGHQPLILSTICEQQGLDNIDSIIEESDGIILQRQFLTHQLINRCSLAMLQMQICAKCKMVGKPFFISGHILEDTLTKGIISTSDLSDITNAVLQGAGFVLRQFNDAVNATKAMQIIDTVCKAVESSKSYPDEFKRIVDEFHIPVNAAEGCVLSAACMLRATHSDVVIVPTVTGKTAVSLARISSKSIIIAITRNPVVARKMQIYKGIYAIIYDKPAKNDWYEETDARVQFAVLYCVKQGFLNYGSTYVVLRKSCHLSAFCDSVSSSAVTSSEITKRLECHYGSDIELEITSSSVS